MAPEGKGRIATMTAWMGRHAGFGVLLALVAPPLAFFSWQPGVATIGDDSISYLNLARYFLHPDDAILREWVGYQAHFPPLFPLLLAVTGAAYNLTIANALVGAFALPALVAVYAYACRTLESRTGALALAAAFMILPTAWVSVRGVMTEPLYLFLSASFLGVHAARLEQPAIRAGDALLAGLLLGAAWLTRSAGLALVAAYGVHAAVRLARTRGKDAALLGLPLAVFAAMALAWVALRPLSEGDEYAVVLQRVKVWVASDPLGFAAVSLRRLTQGWIASFTAVSDVGLAVKAVLLALGGAGVAGAVRRALANHLDGHYVLASLAILFLWPHGEDTMRRLFYPLVPLLLLHAAMLVRPAIARLAEPRARRMAWGGALAVPLLVAFPATLLIAERAQWRDPVLEGVPYRMAGIKDVYTTLPARGARARAASMVAMQAGFDGMRNATPADARVMWVRPDYIAVLGGRHGVPWYYAKGLDGLLHDALDKRVDYIVFSNIYKTDMRGEQSDRFDDFNVLQRFATPVLVVPNAELGSSDFVLLKVDPARLQALVRERDQARTAPNTSSRRAP